MNEYALLIGAVTAIATILLFNRGNLPNVQALYAWYLATFPFYYWLFALFSGYSMVLFKEILFGLPFILLAWICVKLQGKDFSLLLAAGYILHAGYDFYHPMLFVNQGAPLWWPEFCGMINLTLGMYIAVFLVSQRSEPKPANLCGSL